MMSATSFKRRLIDSHCGLLTAVCLLLTAFCFLPSAYGSSWTRQRSGTMAWLHAVHFIDRNHGWVAGSAGTLLETTDGGNTWKKVSTLTKDTLRDVYFADDHSGWLLAERDVFKLKTNDEPRSYLLSTEDGGLTWRQVSPSGFDANARLVRVVFADSMNGWVFGETGAAFVTRDGGANWTRQSLPTKHLLLGGVFVDNTRGWLVGAGATILQTRDGGTTWQSGLVREGAGVRFTAASFVGDRLGWAVGSSGRVYTTSDGGRMWFGQRSNVQSDLFDVKFISAAEGWAAGSDGTILHTFNGGVHWFVEPSNVTHAIERLCIIDQTHGWAVGFGGTILSFGRANAPRLKS
ncbi:MAG TPA: YCF48-related protein [Pyrinomonadaceae bacterium]|nr:YCF48-related protein [Pyrinomonadaceae bacterium]